MEGVRSYLLSLCAVAIVCCCVRRLLGTKGTPAGIGKMLCGVLLTITLLRPLHHLPDLWWKEYPSDLHASAQEIVQKAAEGSKRERDEIIKKQIRAYILEKAAQLGSVLTVEVSLSDDELPVPTAVRLRGLYTPLAQARLQQLLARDLGIPKEKQIWTLEA